MNAEDSQIQLGEIEKLLHSPGFDPARLGPLFWSMKFRRVWLGEPVNSWEPFSIYEKRTKPPRYYPFLEKPYFYFSAGCKHVVIIKGTQIGATELAINLALFFLEEKREGVLYGLPSQAQLKDFSAARIDRVLEHSPKMRGLFTDINNVGLKVGRHASLYLRGTQTPPEEVPVGLVIRDELDRMDETNAMLAIKRLGGSQNQLLFDLSHPLNPGKGIDHEYQNSSQEHWEFGCPKCGTRQEVTWPGSIDFGNRCFICKECGKIVTKQDIWCGDYIAKDPANPVKGLRIPQLLSPTISLEAQILEYELSVGIPYRAAIFANTVLAQPYAESGQRISETDLRGRMIGPPMANSGRGGAIGIDTGKGLHVAILEGDHLVRVAEESSWEDVDKWIENFKPAVVTIDAGPEFHSANTYAEKLRDSNIEAWLCQRVGKLKAGRKIDEDLHIITVEKVRQLDEFASLIWKKKLVLPIDFPSEAIEHFMAPQRIRKETPTGIQGEWIKGTCHYLDAASLAAEGIRTCARFPPADPQIITSSESVKSRWKRL